MRCPTCGRDNPAHYRFCLGCGSELTRPQPVRPPDGEPARQGEAPPAVASAPAGSLTKCPTCASDVPPQFRFCPCCGDALARSQPARPPDGAPARKIDALLAEARDFEKFGMLDEAIDRMEKVVALPGARPEHRATLNLLRSRRGAG
jgi:hypothetical protein